MENSILMIAANLGVGALGMVGMFLIYRADRKRSDCDSKEMLKEYIAILKANQAITEKATVAMERHAVALSDMTKLIEVIFNTMRADAKK